MYPSSISALVLLAGILLNLLPLWAFEAPGTTSKAKAADSWSVSYKPLRLVNGSPIVFHVVSPEPLKSLDGKWLEHEVFFASDSQAKVWYGLAGASLEIRPGNHSLELKGVTATGKDLSFQKHIAVGKGKYHSIAASVPKQYTEPNTEQLQKIDQDKALKERAFAHVTPEREWAGSFRPPVKAQISDVFGTSRTFNGKVQSVHQGLDYAVPEGTPVAAAKQRNGCAGASRYTSRAIVWCLIMVRVYSRSICIFRRSRSKRVIASPAGRNSVGAVERGAPRDPICMLLCAGRGST